MSHVNKPYWLACSPSLPPPHPLHVHAWQDCDVSASCLQSGAVITSTKVQTLPYHKAAFRLGEMHTHASLLLGPERLQGDRGARSQGPDYKFSGMLEQPLVVRDDGKGVEYFKAAMQHTAAAPPYPPAGAHSAAGHVSVRSRSLCFQCKSVCVLKRGSG